MSFFKKSIQLLLILPVSHSKSLGMCHYVQCPFWSVRRGIHPNDYSCFPWVPYKRSHSCFSSGGVRALSLTHPNVPHPHTYILSAILLGPNPPWSICILLGTLVTGYQRLIDYTVTRNGSKAANMVRLEAGLVRWQQQGWRAIISG